MKNSFPFIAVRSIILPVSLLLASSATLAQPPEKKSPQKKARAAFRWINPPPKGRFPHVNHQTFRSPSMDLDVGYNILLPPGYEKSEAERYPVVYYLHGGRPGSESKSVGLSTPLHDAMKNGDVPPAIYVFVNGGPVSHYNMPDRPEAQGEDVFVKELIPHIDMTYRTIAARHGRAIEGFSQGGRGTARIIFKHPELFCSAAPGGGGHATEKKISENDGWENEKLRFAPGDNTWDLARKYARSDRDFPHPRILVFVGTKGFNYENNLAYMQHLKSLGIPFEKRIVDGAPHSAKIIYEKSGHEIMKFHADNFRRAAEVEKIGGSNP